MATGAKLHHCDIIAHEVSKLQMGVMWEALQGEGEFPRCPKGGRQKIESLCDICALFFLRLEGGVIQQPSGVV